MKYASVLAFGALAVAQLEPSCESVVTETAYATYYYCPCSSTSSLASTLLSSSSSTTPGGNGVDPTLTGTQTTSTTPGGNGVDPTLTGTQTTSTASVDSSVSTSTTVSVSVSASSDSSASPITESSTSSSQISIADPPLTSVSLSSTTAPPPGQSTVSVSTTSQAPASTVGPAGTTQTISLSTLGDYQSRALFSHNLHRANATLAPLVWNATQALYAQQLAQTCVYGHSNAQGDGNYGQNIGAGFTAEQIPVMITNSMYNMEINNYPGPYGSDNIPFTLDSFRGWGHYSQIVWRDTTSVGCYTQRCDGGLANTGGNIPPLFTVCNYWPPGNVQGQWSRVGTPSGGASVQFIQ